MGPLIIHLLNKIKWITYLSPLSLQNWANQEQLIFERLQTTYRIVDRYVSRQLTGLRQNRRVRDGGRAGHRSGQRRRRVLGRWRGRRLEQRPGRHLLQEVVQLAQRQGIVQGLQRTDRRHPTESFKCLNRTQQNRLERCGDGDGDGSVMLHGTVFFF